MVCTKKKIKDPADTPDSSVYFCEMSGVKIILFDVCTRHRLIVWCNIFLIAIFALNIMKMSSAFLLFCQNTPDIIFAWKLYVRCEKYKSKFTPDINLSVFNRLFFDTRHPHRIVRCIGRVIKIKTNQTATSHLYWPIDIHPAKNNSNNTRFFYCCVHSPLQVLKIKVSTGDHMFQVYNIETIARA